MERFRGKIKDFYVKTYPTDDLGQELNAEATFEDLFNCLDEHKDVYALFGIGDSLIRERLFAELADIIDAPYDYVYYQFIGSYA